LEIKKNGGRRKVTPTEQCKGIDILCQVSRSRTSAAFEKKSKLQRRGSGEKSE
jgi:hypothetical protein